MQIEIEIIALIIAIISLIVSSLIAKLGWWRHRNIYNIEQKMFFRHPNKENNNEGLKKKLKSGCYTILHTDKYGNDIEIILGKIKK